MYLAGDDDDNWLFSGVLLYKRSRDNILCSSVIIVPLGCQENGRNKKKFLSGKVCVCIYWPGWSMTTICILIVILEL